MTICEQCQDAAATRHDLMRHKMAAMPDGLAACLAVWRKENVPARDDVADAQAGRTVRHECDDPTACDCCCQWTYVDACGSFFRIHRELKLAAGKFGGITVDTIAWLVSAAANIDGSRDTDESEVAEIEPQHLGVIGRALGVTVTERGEVR